MSLAKRPAKKIGVSILACASLALGACQISGPTAGHIVRASENSALTGIQVIELTPEVARQSASANMTAPFYQVLGDVQPIGTVVGVGDALEVTIWEAPPATLFGAAGVDTRIGSAIQTSRPNALPELVVGPSGTIAIPFAGNVPAAGRTLRQIEQEVVRRLTGRANRPQVLVRLANNMTATVAVVGDVAKATRMPLTPRGERILDALAAAEGARQQIDKTTIQITRAGQAYRLSLRNIIDDPRNNVRLQADDIVSALFQPYSFTVLGASGRNDELPFEATGLTLSQALGRMAGLQDGRADSHGVFIFRWIDEEGHPAAAGSAHRFPAIYRVNMRDPATYFAAQTFLMQDKDVVYITNSSVADLQRFVGLLTSAVAPAATLQTAINTN